MTIRQSRRDEVFRRPVHRARLLAALVLIPGVVVAGCSVNGSPPIQPGDASSQNAGLTSYAAGHRPSVGPVTGRTLDGHTFTSAQFLGDVVVVNAWASWCEPCRSEFATLARYSKTLVRQHVHFIGLDEADTRSAASKFVAAAGIEYPSVFDQDSGMLGRLKVLPEKGIPSTMVLDRTGRVAGRVIGAISGAQLTTLVDQAGG